MADGVNSLVRTGRPVLFFGAKLMTHQRQLGALATVTPVTTFAQNNGVIALSQMASRQAGFACCLWLLIAGVFSKFGAALVAIPPSVFGGATTYLFATIVVSGFRVLAYIHWTRRNRFILTAAMGVGLGSLVVPTWFSYVFTYAGDNQKLRGFLDAIVLIVQTPQVIATFIGVILNLVLKENPDDDAEERRKVLLSYGVLEAAKIGEVRN